MSFDPVVLLAMWAAGVAAGGAVVAGWRVAGTGFRWLAGGVAVAVGFAVAFASPMGVAPVVFAALGIVLAKRPGLATVALGAAAVGFLAAAIQRDAVLPAVTGTIALGGITTEMLLGHWYLVDPRLPRWCLRRLIAAGAIGVVGEVAVALVRGSVRSPGELQGAAFLGLSALTLLLAVGVWFSLKEKGYEGVMAATGLSYLATLTVLAVAFLGRA